MPDDATRECATCGEHFAKRPGPGRWPASCLPCRKTKAADTERRGPRGPLAPCGTVPACKRHYKRGESPCGPCLAAMREDSRKRYSDPAQRAKKLESVKRWKAANAAPKPLRVLMCRCGRLIVTTNKLKKWCSRECPLRPTRRKITPMPRADLKGWGAIGSPTNSGNRRWRRLRAEVLAEESHCWLCGYEIDQALKFPHRLSPSVDHVVPLAKGGEHYDRANLRAAHFGCNSSRGAKDAPSTAA